MTEGMRVDIADFRELHLHVHDFLSDVPLHDVWRLSLRGGDPQPVAEGCEQ